MDRITSYSEQNADYDATVVTLLQRDSKALTEWKTSQSELPNLNLPPEALRGFISERVYQLSENPLAVDIRITKSGDKSIKFYVVEKKDHAISNADSLKKVQENGLPDRKLPFDIDPLHWEQIEDVEAGTIHIDDYILTGFYLQQVEDNILEVVAYSDRENLQGKKMGTAQYERLRTVAKEIGFRMIVGQNSEENVGFFVEKLGRSRYKEVSTELQRKVEPCLGINDDDDDFFTIDFLYPEDKATYIQLPEID